MNDLYGLCLELVRKNTKVENIELQETLAISVLAIYLFDEKLVLEKLPKILQELDIIAEEKTVIDIAHEKLGNYQEDEHLKNSNACVTRALEIDEESGQTKEKKTLIISLLNIKENQIKLIDLFTHKLFHLLRFGGIKENDTSITTIDGIAVNRYNKEKRTLKRKNYNLEEGIVQKSNNDAIEMLKEELSKEKDLNDTLKEIKRKIKNYKNNSYQLEVFLLEFLYNSPAFKNLVKQTFYEQKTPSDLALHFNEVLKDNSAFTSFNKNLDELVVLATNEETADLAIKRLEELRRKIQEYLMKSMLIGKTHIKFPM